MRQVMAFAIMVATATISSAEQPLSPDFAVRITRSDVVTVSGKAPTGQVWSLDKSGTPYRDAMRADLAPVWTVQGHDFDTINVTLRQSCRYGVTDHYVDVTLVPGSLQITPDALHVADPVLGTQKALECQSDTHIAVDKLVLIGTSAFGLSAGAWKLWLLNRWIDYPGINVGLLDPDAAQSTNPVGSQ
jgi:hypothetical protein